jgi:hypothetical protein
MHDMRPFLAIPLPNGLSESYRERCELNHSPHVGTSKSEWRRQRPSGARYE